MPEATAVTDNAVALELKIDLSKPGRARLLRRLGKRMGTSATDKRELGDPIRDTGSMSIAQKTIGARATPESAAQSRQTGTHASSPVAGFSSHSSPQPPQI